MFHQPLRWLIVLSLTIMSISITFSQGLFWESVTTLTMAGEQKINSKAYYMPRKFKQVSDQEATIFRLDKELLYTIDYANKEYSEMTFTELEKYIKQADSQLDEQLAELKKQLAEMPAEQREMMEKMMGKKLNAAGGETKIEVTKTKDKKSISGYSCTKYILKDDGKELGSIWTTNDVPDFSSMQKDFKEFSRRLFSQMSLKGNQMSEAIQKVDGFPIQTTISGVESLVNKIEKRTTAASEFEVPAGFKKVKPHDRRDKQNEDAPE